jgi:hypothetical protein
MNYSSIDSSLAYHDFFYKLPRAIIRDVIFRELLSLGDIARLEVAAAVHSIHDSQVSKIMISL